MAGRPFEPSSTSHTVLWLILREMSFLPIGSISGCAGSTRTTGVISTVAGNGSKIYFGDGEPATKAGWSSPMGSLSLGMERPC